MRSNAASLLLVTALILMATTFPRALASSSQWAKYASNPVLVPTAGSWDGDYVSTPRVLYDSGNHVYRMWYQGGLSGVSRVGYATSSDGLNWINHGVVLSPGPGGAWDSASVSLGSVLWNGTVYLMWYTGTNGVTYQGGAVGFAVSTDGLNWAKYSGNPVITPSALGNDQKYIGGPYVIRLKLTYNMWYTGKSAASPTINRILYATSFDGIHWTKWPFPVMSPSTEQAAWDNGSVYGPAVIWTGQLFAMWYSGINDTGLVSRIGFATSPDGGAWTRAPDNPILSPGPPGSWDSAGVEQPCVLQVGNSFMLYYDGYSNLEGSHIGLALSPEGFAVPEFPQPAVELFLGLVICSALYMIFYKRRIGSLVFT